MRRRFVFLASLASAGLIAGGAVTAMASATAPVAAPFTAAPVTGSWGTAQAVPGLAGQGEIEANSVSCVPGGACYAVGQNFVPKATSLSFMATDSGGTWGKPAAIPGLESGLADSARAEFISCPAAGDCLVTGEYGTSAQNGFVLEEIKGKWGKPEPIGGLAGLDTAGEASITGAACPALGDCTVTGTYMTGTPGNATAPISAFVVDEVGYHWGQAAEIPNLGTLNVGGVAASASLVCSSPKYCSLFGLYAPTATAGSASPSLRADLGLRSDATRPGARMAVRSLTRSGLLAALGSRSPGGTQPSVPAVFVDSEVNGVWQQASSPVIPGLTATGFGLPTSNLACASAGNCLLAGLYVPSATSTATDGFLLTESGGKWTVTTSTPATVDITALACPSVGNCVAGGTDRRDVAVTRHQAGATWSAPSELAGATALSFHHVKAQGSDIDELDCPSVGNCTAGGAYQWNVSSSNPVGSQSTFVASEVGGKWSATSVPGGIIGLNSGAEADFTGLSCASAATCAAIGGYFTSSQASGGFLLAEIPLKATSAGIGLAHSRITDGGEQSEKISVRVTARGGTPGGKVSVLYGSRVLCTITLRSGTGSCTLSRTRLSKGTYHLLARYPGSFGFGASSSRPATLTVVS